jgi:hypothetical protein
MDTVVQYLHDLEGKPEYNAESERLRSILCDEDKKELHMDQNTNPIGENTQMIWNDFTKHTTCPVLIVKHKDRGTYKLVRWTDNQLIEENGKTYSWDYNPYHEWSGIT